MRGTAIPHRWWGSCLCGGFRYIYYEMFTTCAALQQRFTTIVSWRELIHAVHIGWFWVGPITHSQHGYIPPVTYGMYKMLDWQQLMSSPWGFTASQPEDLTFYRHTVTCHTLFQEVGWGPTNVTFGKVWDSIYIAVWAYMLCTCQVFKGAVQSKTWFPVVLMVFPHYEDEKTLIWRKLW